MTKNKKIEIVLLKICLLCSGKFVSSAFKCLHGINLILSLMFPVKSETLYGSINVFISLTKHFLCVNDRDVSIQITIKPKLYFSNILKHQGTNCPER